ncbi:Plasmid stabilization system protein [Botrimarina colliarenosi]|uniref:Plasmid stabilization system protein n=1 Tax=Botrimarina colliarenosi TaxID=2528001 RepID=A0A5C6AAZ7_9BACT|nr:type II toxin-antitoxin system RelE/ParE family toxin [Botrimarina colliarenosi]TWT96606.1 Plasmid stabilization system protein [Botrimarina colliarenosi]
MIRYRIEISDRAMKDIEDYVGYIQRQSGSIEIGLRWGESVLKAIEALQTTPTKFQIAAEQVYCDYEVRRVLIGKYLALYHVDETALIVKVLSFRHGARLPQPEDLPNEPPN